MKRVVVCADGTWNEPERKDEKTGRMYPTNVLKIARAVRPRSTAGVDQILYYHEGVGTGSGLDKFTGGAFGEGVEQNVRMLYRFLVFNYEPEDELFLFGFSRGAFTVRTLAGFMRKVGLLNKEDEYYTPRLYELYERGVPRDSPEWTKAFEHVRVPRAGPSILFMGVFDTVGALGAPGMMGQLLNPKKYAYHDIALGSDIKNAFHALAIDERRQPFAPSVWERPAGWNGALEQVWFAGVHSNIGGSYSPDGLANEALHWMVEKAESLGLEFDSGYLAHYLPCFNSTLNDSMTAMYKVLGPFVRPIGANGASGEGIHQSVIDRVNLAECKYAPVNAQDYLKSASRRVVNTQRIARGQPCPPM